VAERSGASCFYGLDFVVLLTSSSRFLISFSPRSDVAAGRDHGLGWGRRARCPGASSYIWYSEPGCLCRDRFSDAVAAFERQEGLRHSSSLVGECDGDLKVGMIVAMVAAVLLG
jgi:hypothetical protein